MCDAAANSMCASHCCYVSTRKGAFSLRSSTLKRHTAHQADKQGQRRIRRQQCRAHPAHKVRPLLSPTHLCPFRVLCSQQLQALHLDGQRVGVHGKQGGSSLKHLGALHSKEQAVRRVQGKARQGGTMDAGKGSKKGKERRCKRVPQDFAPHHR